MQNEKTFDIYISHIFISQQTDHISSAAASEMGHHFIEVELLALSLFKKGVIIYNRCLLFIFSNPFIMKVHCMTPGSYITPLCMWDTCIHLIYRWSCRTVIFLLWKYKSRSSLSMRELSQFAMCTGKSIISVLTVLF